MQGAQEVVIGESACYAFVQFDRAGVILSEEDEINDSSWKCRARHFKNICIDITATKKA